MCARAASVRIFAPGAIFHTVPVRIIDPVVVRLHTLNIRYRPSHLGEVIGGWWLVIGDWLYGHFEAYVRWLVVGGWTFGRSAPCSTERGVPLGSPLP